MATKKDATGLVTASVLAFERKLDPSDALFFAGAWEARGDSAGWPAVEVRAKSVRGTISNRLKTKDADPAKLDAAIQNPNLQTVDVAALPAEADTSSVPPRSKMALFCSLVQSGIGLASFLCFFVFKRVFGRRQRALVLARDVAADRGKITGLARVVLFVGQRTRIDRAAAATAASSSGSRTAARSWPKWPAAPRRRSTGSYCAIASSQP